MARILIKDDDARILKMLRQILEREPEKSFGATVCQ